MIVDPESPACAHLELAARLLREGRLVALPTETFYGLGANALDPDAVARVFQAKARPAGLPLLVLVDSTAMVRAVAADIPPRAERLMARHWPGALTLVLPARPELPPALTGGTRTIGVRLSSHPLARALVRSAGLPLTAPSANRHGAGSPRTAVEVAASLGDAVDLIVDGGPTLGGLASTVVDLTGPRPRVVRAGAVTLDALDLGEP